MNNDRYLDAFGLLALCISLFTDGTWRNVTAIVAVVCFAISLAVFLHQNHRRSQTR